MFLDMHSRSPGSTEDDRRRHKSESESTRKLYKDKVDFRTRHCSGSAIKRDSPTLFLEQCNEADCSKDLQLCSEDFGCDADIICRIGGKAAGTHLKKDANGLDNHAKGTFASEGHEQDLLGLGLNENLTSTQQKTKRPRSPNIPIKKKHSNNSTNSDFHRMFEEKESDEFSESNNTFSSPGKDSWFNLDILPRMTSSLSSSLGFNGNGSSNLLSSWSMSLNSKSAKVARSATFCEDHSGNDSSKKLLRSSTLPVSESPSQEHLATLDNECDETDSSVGNSWLTPIKNNFRRTESFRIKEGLNNLRSRASTAANSVASKITEIKQSISASNTPVKGTHLFCFNGNIMFMHQFWNAKVTL